MVKFLTTALGGLTALAVFGLVTPSGQAVLGLHHQTQPPVPVSIISDPGPANATIPAALPTSTAPAAAPVPVPEVYHHAAIPVHAAAPVERPAAVHQSAPVARHVTHPAYHAAASRPVYRPAAVRPAPVARPATPSFAGGAGFPMGMGGGMPGLMQLLPGMLQQGGLPGATQYAPGAGPQYVSAPSNDPGWRGRHHGRGHWRHDGGGDQGDRDPEHH
jgi:hypothetical protein